MSIRKKVRRPDFIVASDLLIGLQRDGVHVPDEMIRVQDMLTESRKEGLKIKQCLVELTNVRTPKMRSEITRDLKKAFENQMELHTRVRK